MSITQRQRNEAALICAVCASSGLYSWQARDHLGTNAGAQAIAAQAYHHALRVGLPRAETYAEAEALLRTGWTP